MRLGAGIRCNKKPRAPLALGSMYLVTPVGFEPTTFRSGGERSNPLSYGANGL